MPSRFYDLFPPLPLPDEMRQWDAQAMALGLPEELLMENAARAALDVLRVYRPHLAGLRVWLLMGGGNNGGDAACLARHLLDAGAHPLVLHTRPLSSYKGACGKHVRIARAAGVIFTRYTALAPQGGTLPDIVVDGLLGTGFCGTLRPETLEIIRRVNALPGQPFVLAIDIPSGLDGRTGLAMPEAIRATATVSFAAAKPGLALPHARPWTGELHVRGIGIPLAAQRRAPCSFYAVDGRSLAPLARIQPDGFKNSYGHVLVVGGAPGLGGAAHLAARAALRAGAGLVTAAAPGAGIADIKNGWPEIMTLPLGETQGRWPASLPEHFVELVGRCAALVVGPGMGRGADAADFIAALLALPHRPPTVFDADALMLMAGRLDLQARLRAHDVLTPHPGEAAALLGSSAADVQADRQSALKRLCGLSRAVVVLKGAASLVGQGEAPTLLCPYDVPQLAVGGSGDVLAGCMGGLLARMLPQPHAPQYAAAETDNTAATVLQPAHMLAGQAVALHALAGKSLAGQWPLRGNTPSAVADALPAALAAYTATPAPEDDFLPWPR
ncbi:NAD(P)H-hydrate dehydratase [Desulfovibrio desulfuricans]|uniref:Bifunctional NAD(P)H-hydrate repair enzyme n=1 Tax=Desulfovibrio desulfuricans TaxID=876 RepID=A0A4P7UKQ0_DESDE|nr:NAD(P)H-hydrate dehydratase [Desulfovibrio desulfuricans]QCC85414.1 NAD(P)H-hydrate dehydratase [Desulfovibrio desulfuricans]